MENKTLEEIADKVSEGAEAMTDALGLTGMSEEERLALADLITNALPTDLESIRVKNEAVEEKLKQQEREQLAKTLFGEDVDLNAKLPLKDENGDIIYISYGAVIEDFIQRGPDAYQHFSDILNSSDLKNVLNKDKLEYAQKQANEWINNYKKHQELFDALGNFVSPGLIFKMVAEGVTDVAQATGLLKATAEKAGELQGAAITALQKLKDVFSGKGASSGSIGNNALQGIDETTSIGGKTCVYVCVVDGVTRYVGITDNIVKRGQAHLREKGIVIDKIEGLQNISRDDARAVEQTLIDYYGLGKDGGTLINKINSISKVKNPTKYEQALIRGAELLNKVGYEGF